MSNAKHTQGPWNSGVINAIPATMQVPHAFISGPSHQWIAETLICGATSYEERNANARLISAAPDLLAALELCLDALDKCNAAMYGGPTYDPIASSWKEQVDARAAIAKAKGIPA